VRTLVLAAEGLKDRDIWYPTILGVLVVIAAVSLFMGSIYLLLATNLGSRLGFLVAAAGLSGFMVLLSLLWLTTSSPLNTLKGRPPSWKAVESIEGGDLARSKIPAVRAITDADKLTDAAEKANVKAAVDTVVVTPQGPPSEEETGATSRFQIYSSATDYLVPDFFETGGGNIFSQVDIEVNGQFPILHVSLHKPQYAVVNICTVDQDKLVVPFGDTPPTPKCDPDEPINTVVFERDLGSVRVPPFVALVGSSILFILCLLSLHWRERDLQEKAAALQAEADRATTAALERAPEKV
jgi:hypothetical protein